MKTKVITGLKKEVLVIELPENGYWETYRDGTEIRDFLTDEKFVTDYIILGTPDEIKEEDVIHLVERTGLGNPSYSGNWYECYKNPDAMYSSALDSFFSAIESEIYWINPVSLERADHYRKAGNEFSYNGIMKYWNKAQEKTFDKNRTLIFVKN